MFYCNVLNILTDEKGNTVGAEFQTQFGILCFNTSYLKSNRNTFIVNNAIIDANGFVRAKSGNLSKKVIYNDDNNNRPDKIILLHGSKSIIEKPIFGKGERTNDYGYGFYTVLERNLELAKEWACSPYNKTKKGFVNKYEFKLKGMNVLNLDEYPIIYWIVLTAHFRETNIDRGIQYKLEKKYLLDLNTYDCVYGWRCDDTYSNIITSFFAGNLSAEAVAEAIHLGHLQEQFVLISKKAFSNIRHIDTTKVDNFATYNKKFMQRKTTADKGLKECRNNNRNGTYIEEFLRGL